jgi:hypothetical protein
MLPERRTNFPAFPAEAGIGLNPAASAATPTPTPAPLRNVQRSTVKPPWRRVSSYRYRVTESNAHGNSNRSNGVVQGCPPASHIERDSGSHIIANRIVDPSSPSSRSG